MVKRAGFGAKVKKLCWHTTLGDIAVEEPQYRKGGKRIRAFARSAKVSHRGCSKPLQRAVTDFGADVPFAQAMDKLVEHYGVVLAESTIRRITEGHAQALFEAVKLDEVWPTRTGHEDLIAQMDGGMVPTVEPQGQISYWDALIVAAALLSGCDTLYTEDLEHGRTFDGQLTVVNPFAET